MIEPAVQRAVAFIDGQNLYHQVRAAFGYHFPNYNVRKLVDAIASQEHWDLMGIHFYTGIPDAADDPMWNRFWTNKLASMGRQGIKVFTRPLRYRNKAVTLPDGTVHTFLHGEQKGIDVRLALDVIGKAVRNELDVAFVFSQDQDLSEVADEIRVIARQQNRWIRIACAYPISPACTNKRGITGTDWIKIDRRL